MSAIADDVRGPYPDGLEWRCMRCGAMYPADYEPNTCVNDGGGLARTMLSFKLPAKPTVPSKAAHEAGE